MLQIFVSEAVTCNPVALCVTRLLLHLLALLQARKATARPIFCILILEKNSTHTHVAKIICRKIFFLSGKKL